MDGLEYAIVHYWSALKELLAIDPARLLEPEMVIRLSLQAVLLMGSAFFSSSETALFSLSRLDLQKLRKERHRHSETLHALLDQPRRLIISILCGNELINIAAAANMTGILVSLYGVGHAGWLNLFVMAPLLLLFGEITPKTIAVSNPVRISADVVAAPIHLWVKVIAPLRWLIRGVSDGITTLVVGREKAADNILHVDEFKSLVEEVAKEGELNATERALIYNILEAGDTEIVEIMTPRTRTAFLNADTTVPEMVERFNAYRHARVPVFRIHRDNLVGFLHAEDVLRLVLNDANLDTLKPEDVMRPAVVVPLTKKVDEMFDFFQANNARAAAVLNEFGGVEGLITMTDVLTFIFGEISGAVRGQEHYKERDENVYEVPGDMKLTDFNDLTNFGIEDPRMTTIAGVAFRHLDRLPQVGDKVAVEGITISITEMDAHRISRVRTARMTAAAEEVATVESPAEAPGQDSMAGVADAVPLDPDPGADMCTVANSGEPGFGEQPRQQDVAEAPSVPEAVEDSHGPAEPETTPEFAGAVEGEPTPVDPTGKPGGAFHEGVSESLARRVPETEEGTLSGRAGRGR